MLKNCVSKILIREFIFYMCFLIYYLIFEREVVWNKKKVLLQNFKNSYKNFLFNVKVIWLWKNLINKVNNIIH